MAGHAAPVPPKPSVSLLLLREGERGLEVLTVLRSRRMGFAAGMLAFPGGGLDPGDQARTLRWRARRGSGLSRGECGHRLAALRELFEETGILLARRAGCARRLGASAAKRLAVRYRGPVHRGVLSFAAMAERADLALETDRLVPFAHWVTPAVSAKRYDTRFYLAAMPAGQRAVSDGIETQSLAWRSPGEVLEAWRAGSVTVMFPTRLNLMKLAEAETVADAFARARARRVRRIIPELAGDGSPRLVIPADAGFPVTVAEESDMDPLERQGLQAHLQAHRDGG